MLEIGQVLDGKYRILSEIGRNGMSVVYLALDEKNNTWVVKEIRDDGSKAAGIYIQAMRRIVEVQKEIRHPQIPYIIATYEQTDSYIIVMNHIEGISLDSLILQKHNDFLGNSIDVIENQTLIIKNEFISWMTQVCEILHYLHTREKPIVHRNITPSNILYNFQTRCVYLIGFDIIKQCDINDHDHYTECLGVPGFAAPEQYGGLGRTDARTDIYALGMTMYSLLTGIDPRRESITDTSIRIVDPAFSYELDQMIVKATQRDRDKRHQSCDELAYELKCIPYIYRSPHKGWLHKIWRCFKKR